MDTNITRKTILGYKQILNTAVGSIFTYVNIFIDGRYSV